jgi:rhomboid protease GluP
VHSADAPIESAVANEAATFARTLSELTPHVFVTPAIIVVNISVYAVMVIRGVDPIQPKIDDLIRWGADFGPRTTSGELWRLLTCNYLHIGLLHLLFNMWVLWDVGQLVERLFGHVGFFILYTVSGLIGSLASLVANPFIVSAGASGAVFGVYGALLATIMKQHGSIPTATLQRLKNSTFAFVVYNLIFGFTVEGIDMAAHIGGLIGGFLCGLILTQPLTAAMLKRRPFRNLAAGFGGAIMIAMGLLLLPEGLVDPTEIFQHGAKVEEKALNLYKATLERVDRQQLSEAELATIVERDILPDWRKVTAQVSTIRGVPRSKRPLVDKFKLYMQTRQESWELLVQAIREGDQAKAAQSQKQWRAADDLARQVATESKK